MNLIPSQAAKRYGAIPVAFVGDDTLLVAMSDPTNVRAVDDISIMTGLDVRPAVASAEDIDAAVSNATQARLLHRRGDRGGRGGEPAARSPRSASRPATPR